MVLLIKFTVFSQHQSERLYWNAASELSNLCCCLYLFTQRWLYPSLGNKTAFSSLRIYPQIDVLGMLTYYLWVCTGWKDDEWLCVCLFSHWLHPEAFWLPGHRLPCSHSQQRQGLSVVQEGQQIQNPQRCACVCIFCNVSIKIFSPNMEVLRPVSCFCCYSLHQIPPDFSSNPTIC